RRGNRRLDGADLLRLAIGVLDRHSRLGGDEDFDDKLDEMAVGRIFAGARLTLLLLGVDGDERLALDLVDELAPGVGVAERLDAAVEDVQARRRRIAAGGARRRQ